MKVAGRVILLFQFKNATKEINTHYAARHPRVLQVWTRQRSAKIAKAAATAGHLSFRKCPWAAQQPGPRRGVDARGDLQCLLRDSRKLLW